MCMHLQAMDTVVIELDRHEQLRAIHEEHIAQLKQCERRKLIMVTGTIAIITAGITAAATILASDRCK